MSPIHQQLLQQLDAPPVLGVSLANVSVLRLDKCGGAAPGNKSFKLKHFLEQARATGISRLVSFGGAWSNHLHALAAAGREQGFETIGLVRGETASTAMLKDVQRLGMRVEYLERSEYRRRNDRDYQAQVLRRYGPCLLVPEGGSGTQGAQGCVEIGRFLAEHCGADSHVVLPVGTGTTLAGVVLGLGASGRVTGISALKGASDLEGRVAGALTGPGSAGLEQASPARWEILHDYHCGGFARVNESLREFILAFEAVHHIPLDPVYTGKMLFAVHSLLAGGKWRGDEPVVAIHTGGLQGRRGYPWLAGAGP